MKGRSRASRPLVQVAVALLTVLVVSPIALRTASAAKHTGALFTTDSTCTTQNENHYENRGTVFLHGTHLTDGEYYVQVTEPNGTLLGTSADPAAGDQTPITVVDGEIQGCPRLWDLVVKASDHTRGYDATGNNGGVYRVEISQNADFSGRKSDNFKVANNECEPGNTAPDCGEQPPTVGNVDLTPKVDTNPVGTNHTVTAHVTDTQGADFEGAGVRFEVWRSGAEVTSGTDTTDANGIADFTYTGPATPAQDRIIACTNPDGTLPASCTDASGAILDSVVADEAQKNWEAQPPTVGSVDLGLDATNPPGDDSHTVTAHVEDTEGNPFVGAGVRFEVWRDGAQQTYPNNTQTTDANGNASFTYTFTGTRPETDRVIACTEPDGDLPASCTNPDGSIISDGSIVADEAQKTWEDGGGVGATFSCRASVLRIEDNPILQGLLGEDGDPFEPWVANRDASTCNTDNAGLLQDLGLTGGDAPVLPGSDGEIVLASEQGSLTIGVLNNKTSSGTNSGSAESYVLKLEIHDATGEGLDIHVLRSTASADCAGGSGTSEIISINGEPADLNAEQEPIPLGGLGTLYLGYSANEPTGDGGFVQTQRAVWLDGTEAGTGGDPSPLGSVIVGEAIADRHGACAA
jgi:protocatechuate 3,4-dioxygenase beta subunit